MLQFHHPQKAFEILKNFFYETKNVQFEECQVNYCHIRSSKKQNIFIIELVS